MFENDEQKQIKLLKEVNTKVKDLFPEELKAQLLQKAKADNTPQILRKKIGDVYVELRIG